MRNHITIVSILLTCVAILTNQGFCEEKMPVELKLSVYPEKIAFGDTCYVMVTATNHTNEMARVLEPGFKYPYGPDMVQFDLNRQGKRWRGTFECWIYEEVDRLYLGSVPIPSGESVTFLAVSLQFPPLEDLYRDAFWEEIRKELKNHPEGLSFEFGIECACPIGQYESPENRRARLTQNVTVKLRNDKEMAVIEEWYRNTPTGFFPKIVEGDYILKVPSLSLDEQMKRMLNPNDRQWYFLTIGNRYPGDPNVPETWQGWKELEENISPSTMRDEIRLTRILIQYCDTKDEKVLEELKTWFAGMNEVQRTCMAKSVCDRAKDCYGTDLLPSFRELYKTIREYDIAARSEGKTERLKQLELIE